MTQQDLEPPLGTEETVILDVPEDQLQDRNIIPPAYNQLDSPKRWMEAAIAWICLSILAFIALVALLQGGYLAGLPFLLLALLPTSLLVGVFMSYREYYRWKNEPRYADPEEGTFYKYQAMNKWLGLLGAQPRQIHLDTAEYLPGTKTLLEQYLPLRMFRYSCTLTIDGPGQHDEEYFKGMRHVMHGEMLDDIIRYRKRLVGIQHEEDMSYQERQAVAAEKTVDLLGEILDRLNAMT